MSDDTMTPCSVCGRPGHWESRHSEDAGKIAALESRLALYEGWTPVDADTKEALGLANNCDLRQTPKTIHCKALQVLARALKAAMGKMDDAVESAGHFELDWHKEKTRAEKAEAANQELEAKLEEARKALSHCLEVGGCPLCYEKQEHYPDECDHPTLKDYIESTIAHLGQPSPVLALKDKVIEAARTFKTMVDREVDAYVPTQDGLFWSARESLIRSVAALDSAEAKGRG